MAAVVNNMMDNKLNVMKPIKEVVILPVYSMELNATEIQVAANGIIKKWLWIYKTKQNQELIYTIASK